MIFEWTGLQYVSLRSLPGSGVDCPLSLPTRAAGKEIERGRGLKHQGSPGEWETPGPARSRGSFLLTFSAREI